MYGGGSTYSWKYQSGTFIEDVDFYRQLCTSFDRKWGPLKVFRHCSVYQCETHLLRKECRVNSVPSLYFQEKKKESGLKTDSKSFSGSRPVLQKICPTENWNQNTLPRRSGLNFLDWMDYAHQSHSEFTEWNPGFLTQLQETLDSQICILSEENLHKCDFKDIWKGLRDIFPLEMWNYWITKNV